MVYRFEYQLAGSTDEALAALQENSEAQALAGATNIIVDARAERAVPKAVIDINRLDDLQYIRADNGQVHFGARTTLTDCFALPIFEEKAQVLKLMAYEFAGPLIRNRATIAGNIAYASPAADTAPALLALGASITLTSKERGERTMPLSEFFLGPRKTALEQDELITEFSFPVANQEDTKSGYFKFALRKAMAISLVSGAVVLHMDGETIREAGLALGAVSPVPYRVTEAEELLNGQKPSEALFQEAAEIAVASSSPIGDIRSSDEYRRAMTKVMVRRMLEQALAS